MFIGFNLKFYGAKYCFILSRNSTEFFKFNYTYLSYEFNLVYV